MAANLLAQPFIDLASGQVAIAQPLAALPDPIGPAASVVLAYRGDVRQAVTTWNLTRPTGITGLGWHLVSQRIERDADGGVAFVSDVRRNPLVQVRVGSDGARIYQCEHYRFWQIRYDVARERWEVMGEDGVRAIYGDAASGRATVQWGVAWGAWIGASSDVAGQQPVATVWNLAEVVDLWGNRIRYAYDQDVVAVGTNGLTYTRASYLAGIVGAAGGRIELDYAPKDPQEYMNPHGALAPNAWQSRFETRFLQTIRVFSPSGALLTTTTLAYASDFLGADAFSKRLLTGWSTKSPSGDSRPGYAFSYDTAASSPTGGMMAGLTTPAGRQITFAYTSLTVANSARSTALPMPVASGKSFSQPRLWFERDYVVVTWLRSDDNAQILAYTWSGRWLAATLDLLPVGSNYAALQVAVAPNSFVVTAGTSAVAYYVNAAMSGTWVSSGVLGLTLTGGEPVRVAAGDGIAAVLGATSGKLNPLLWTGQAWQQQTVTDLSNGATSLAVALAGSAGFLVAGATSAAAPLTPVTLCLMWRDARNAWQQTLLGISRTMPMVGSLSIACGDAFAAVGLQGPSGGNTRLQLGVLGWAQQFQSPAWLDLADQTFAPSATPAIAVNASSIASGQVVYRYDGARWSTQDLAAITYSGQQSVAAISYGVDRLVRTIAVTGGTYRFDVVDYAPNLATSATPWSATLTSTAASAAYAASAARTRRGGGRDIGSNYVLLNSTSDNMTSNAIYYRMPDGTWSAAQVLPDTLTATELPSLQILGEHYCIYQTGSNTVLYALANGGVASTGRIPLSSQQIMVPDAPPTLLVGPTAFATYSGSWSATPSLTLYRVATGRVDGTQALEVVDTVACNDGYDSATTAYGFTASTATIDADGEVAGFNQATSATGATSTATTPYGSTVVNMFNDLTPADAVNPAYPNKNNWSNAATYTRLLQGRCYQTQVLPASGTPVNSVETIYWWVFPQALDGAGGRRGYYDRIQARSRVLDGVTTTTQFAYASETGLTSTSTTWRFNSQGTQDTLVTAYTYWWQQYDPSRVLNLLTPVIQTQTITNGTTTGIAITTWRNDWAARPGVWAPSADYVATQAAPATFNHWSPTTAPLAAGWQLQSAVTARSACGVAARSVNAIGTASSQVLDVTGAFTVADFANADTGALAASYYGFEPYESNPFWSYLGGNLAANITTAQSHTGSRSLMLTANANAVTGPTATFLATTGNGIYVFSCWMLLPSGFVSNPANAQWSPQAYTVANPPVAVGTPVTLPFPNETGQWQYLSTIINLGTIRSSGGVGANVALSVTVTGFNKVASSGTIYIDELRFSPIDAQYAATVYDVATFAPSARLGQNGATMRLVRDAAEEVVATIGPGDNVAQISVPAYARAMTPNGTFDPNLPNSRLNLCSSANGVYFDFDASDAAAWTLPTGWSVTHRQLAYDGTVTSGLPGSLAVLNGFSNANYAARVSVHYTGATPPPASIGCGNVYAGWDASQSAWVLSVKQNSIWTNIATRSGTFGSEWLFLLIDGLASLFISGNEVFSLQLPNGVVPDGKLQLGLGAAGAFAELAVAVDPCFDIAFYDGGGRFMQRLQLADNSALVASGVLYDAIGRTAYDKNPIDSTLAIGAPPQGQQGAGAATDVQRIDGALTAYLPYLDGKQMTLEQYLDPANGSPFRQIAYEATPLSRPTAFAWPGPTLTMGSNHAAQLSYGCNQAGDFLQSLLPPSAPGAATGSYYLRGFTDPDGNLIQRVVNQSGQLIAEHLVPAAQGAATSTTFFAYDGAGNLTAVRQPNYYAPPNGSQAATWQIQRSYTFLGQVASVTQSDSGTTQFLYDALGRQRFRLTAAGAAQSNPLIIYYLYDGLNRPIEQGWIQAAGVTWAIAAANVNNQTWPSGVAGAVWYRRQTYDLMPSGASAPNLVGRMSQAAVNSTLAASPSAFDTHGYAYDLAGDVTTITSTVPSFSSTAYQASFSYNNLGQTTGVTYPLPLESGQPIGIPTLVTYFYNRLGQLACVGNAPRGDEVVDPENPANGPMQRYALHSYTADGQVLSESFNNLATPYARTYQYTPANWLAGMSGDFYAETVTFGTGGIGNSAYYDGKITGWTTTYRDSVGGDSFMSPTSYQAAWTYSYDGQGRLAAAACLSSIGESTRTIGSASAPITYDANGNFGSVPLGAATQQYSYKTSSPQQARGAPEDDPLPGQANDEISLLTTTLNAAIGFTNGENRAGWSWGANNRGPSASAIATWTGPSGPPNNAYLALAGGRVGHYEYLQFDGPFDPACKLQLQYWLNTPTPFGSQSGAAGWYLSVRTALGSNLLVQVKDLAAGSNAWAQSTVTVDVPSLVAAMALDGPIIGIAVILINAKQSGGSPAGAALQVSAISLVSLAAQSPQPYQYNANGAAAVAPPMQITTIDYCPVNGRAAGLTVDRTEIEHIGYCYGAIDAHTAAITTNADGSKSKAFYFLDPEGRRIACFNQPAGTSNPLALYYIYGARGLIAASANDGVSYAFTDRLDSLRVVVDPAGDVCELYDYSPFGETLHAQCDAVPLGFGFAGQPTCDPKGLVSFMGRLYDPSLRTCLDANAGGLGTPYTMADGNSVGVQANSVAAAINAAQAVVVSPPQAPPRTPDWYVSFNKGTAPIGVPWLYQFYPRRAPTHWPPQQSGATFPTAGTFELKPLAGGMRQKDTEIAKSLHKEGRLPATTIEAFYNEDPRRQDFKYLNLEGPLDGSLEGEYVYVILPGPPVQMVLYQQPLAGRRPDDLNYIRHSQLARGESVFAAGGAYFSNGVVVITEESGHYRPETERMIYTLAFLRRVGYEDVSHVHYEAFKTPMRDTFVKDKQSDISLGRWFTPPEEP